MECVTGGPPCQAFSLNNTGVGGKKGSDLPREFVKLATKLKPSVIVMEEVPNFVRLNEGEFYRGVKEEVEKAMYAVTFEGLIDSQDVRSWGVRCGEWGEMRRESAPGILGRREQRRVGCGVQATWKGYLKRF